MPLGVSLEFIPSLVGLIKRIEEGHRICNVDDDRQAKRSGCLPNRVNPRIVDGDPIADVVDHFETERLPDLQSLRPPIGLDSEATGCPFTEAITVLGPLRPVHTPEVRETFGMLRFERIEMSQEDTLTPSSVEVDDRLDTGIIHHVDKFTDGSPEPITSPLTTEMCVSIDHGERGTLDRGRRKNKLGSRQLHRFKVS